MSGFPSHVWRKVVCALPIPAAQKVVLIRLAEYADYTTGRDAWPGRQRLADDCGVSPSAVDRAIKAGRRHKMIRQTGAGHKGANPEFCLVAPDQSASAVTHYRPKRVTTDNQSASLVTRLPTHAPTPNENEPNEVGPSIREESSVDSSSSNPPSSKDSRSELSSTPRSSSLGYQPDCVHCQSDKSHLHHMTVAEWEALRGGWDDIPGGDTPQGIESNAYSR
jgi:hypothetical protein